MTKIRHFTATGIVVWKDSSLVHWHRKVGEWLAPGGHVEPNEDPVQTTLREALEETGLNVQVMPTYPAPDITNLEQVIAPYTVMVEDVFDRENGAHQHIDFIYFVTPTAFEPGKNGYPAVPEGWVWMSRDDLEAKRPLTAPDGREMAPPEDVITLSLTALDRLNGHSA